MQPAIIDKIFMYGPYSMDHIVWSMSYHIQCIDHMTHMVYTLNIYHFRTINMYETFNIVCVIFVTWAQKGNLRKLITIYLIVFLYVQTYLIYLGEIGSHQDIFHFTKIESISPSFFSFHQDFLDFTKSPPISPSENFTKSLTKCG